MLRGWDYEDNSGHGVKHSSPGKMESIAEGNVDHQTDHLEDEFERTLDNQLDQP